MTEDGWCVSSSLVSNQSLTKPKPRAYTGRAGTAPCDPVYGFKLHKELYLKADPNYSARYTVPVLWDKKKETIVNNESSEIIRILYSAFDAFISPAQREVNKPNGGFLPETLREQIDEMNEWVYSTINNGVYRCGFATTQEAYEEAVYPLFASLDRIEEILATNAREGKGPYLFGKYITEADIRLFPTIIRFDAAYYTVRVESIDISDKHITQIRKQIFKCNLKMVRYSYPYIHTWLRKLYWDESEVTKGAFKSTTYFDHVSCFTHEVKKLGVN